MEEYEFHEAANLFPLMDEDELDSLAQDILENGQREAIWVADDKIIDGRNRYLACKRINVEPSFRYWSFQCASSITAFVLSLNLHRRHLTTSQRAAVAADAMPLFEAEAKERRAATLKQNADKAKLPERSKGQSRDEAAEQLNVSPRYVEDAKHIKQHAPELHEKVKAGEVSLQQAKRQLSPPKPKAAKDAAFEVLERFKKLWSTLEQTEKRLIREWLAQEESE